jgi:hypothetical protein
VDCQEAVPSKKRKIRHETSDGTDTPAATVGEDNSDEDMRDSAPAETSDQNSGGDKAQPKTKSKPSKKKKSKGEATAVKSETTDAVMPKIEEITFDGAFSSFCVLLGYMRANGIDAT